MVLISYLSQNIHTVLHPSSLATAAHLAKYGKVTRCNRVMVTATHYTNPGGAVADRDDTSEQYNISVLRHKWPGVFPQHGTRGPNEVSMRWNMRSTILGGNKNVKRPPAPEGWVADVPLVHVMPKGTSNITSFFGGGKGKS